MSTQKIRISPQFLQSDAFKQLAMMAGEAIPITLGRVTMLALLMASTERQRFMLDEIEIVSGWSEKRWYAAGLEVQPSDPYAVKLERVGWARRRGVFFTLDIPLVGTRPRGRGGVERAARAARSSDGRFQPKASTARLQNKDQIKVDAEGNVIKGKI